YATNTLDTTQQHNAHNQSQDNAQYQVDGRYMVRSSGNKLLNRVINRTGNVTHLYSVSDTKGGQTSEDTENNCQPFPVLSQPIANVVHRTAYPVAMGIALAVFYRQQHLGILGGHTKQSGNPQPENGARAT